MGFRRRGLLSGVDLDRGVLARLKDGELFEGLRYWRDLELERNGVSEFALFTGGEWIRDDFEGDAGRGLPPLIARRIALFGSGLMGRMRVRNAYWEDKELLLSPGESCRAERVESSPIEALFRELNSVVASR
jgi:hypothetical protein